LEDLSAFVKIAPQLSNPLVLIGFVLLLVFSVHRVLIKSRIIPPVAKTAAPSIIKLILHYGFIISVLVITLGFVYAFLQYFKHDWLASYSGTLTPRNTLLFSPDGGKITKIQVGQARVFLVDPNNPLAAQLYPALRTTQFKVENVDGEVKVSAQMLDREGDLIVELVRNEWKVAPPPRTWDRNYSDDAIEVRDDRGLVVLQVRALKDRVQLQGHWWIDLGPPNGIRQLTIRETPGGEGADFTLSSPDLSPPPIEPMFEYPSDGHPGELRQTH
jgi:hypothetical protein